MVIVFYTDLRIFRAARDGDKLGQHKERDVLSGSVTAAGTLRWSRSVRSGGVQMEIKSVAWAGSEKKSGHV